MRISKRAAVALGLIMILASCASQPDASNYSSAPGFFSGIWHGLVAPIAFFFAIFTDVRMYAFPNSGNWYDFGFLLGLSAWAGGAASAG